MATLRFVDHRGTVTEMPVQPGQDVLAQALAAKADITYLCMAGSCRTCLVKVSAGAEHLEPAGPAENPSRLTPGYRLACQCVTAGTGDVTIEQR